ncbi:MAG: polysaccharide deacetylase family protein [Pirellulales bacterium]|nr:polysaccharide deacetylase family protein [Pirellulales bacterium]
MNRGVFITFDVECSMGGAWRDPSLKPVPPSRAVWGEFGDRSLGLPLIVEILERHALAATFFVEAFIREQGYPGETERICEYLLNHGQDVQLHIHPNHRHYGLKQRGQPFSKTDQMADLSPAEQLALLHEGADRIQRWTGRRPAAFRAGNMGASEETLKQLEASGIPIDSSYTFPYAGGQCRFGPGEPYNGSKWYGRVLELALSGLRQPRWPGLRPAKPLDLMGISFKECRDAVRLICGAGADAVLILHSFSLFKVRTIQYDGGRLNRIVTRRLDRFCEWLATAREFPTRTFAELAEAVADGSYEPCHRPPCLVKHPRAIVRKAVQAWNNLYWT